MSTNAPFPGPTTPNRSNSNHRRRQTKNANSDSGFNRLRLYLEAIERGRVPSKSVLISSIRSCSDFPPASDAEPVHGHVLKIGLGSDRFVGSSLVAFYSKKGSLRSARRVFDGIVDKDAALYTALLAGCRRSFDIDSARDLFDHMPERDVVAWNAMMSQYLDCGLPTSALELFKRMQASGVESNDVTLVVALSACSQLGCLQMGEWIHSRMSKELDMMQATPKLYNSLVHMYARCGRLDAALQLFLEKEDRNLELWNTMLTGFAVHGCGMAAMSLLSQMIKCGQTPDRITFVGLLMACSHAGIVEYAQRFFVFMSSAYGVERGPEHYGCLVDVLARAGCLEEAYSLVRSMPYEDDVYVWGALLSGCYTHGNYELGLEAASHLLELQPWNESRYIAMININVLLGRFADAIEIRRKMLDTGIKKSSACSIVEVDGVVHEFIAGDGSHCRSRDIYLMIEFISRHSEGNNEHFLMPKQMLNHV